MIELVVVKGNLLFLQEIFKDFYSELYLPHFFELCWTPNYNRAVRHHLQSKDKRFSYDFASTHSHKPSSSLCCQRFRTTNIEVFIVDSQPTEGITIRRNLVQNKEEHKMEVQFKTFPKRKVASWFIYTSTKPSATIHNVAESHILKGFDTANRDILECPTFDPDDLRLDQQSFLSSALESPWVFSSSDNCSAQYRSPRHFYQIATRGHKYGHYSIHTFSAPQHGKQQAAPAGGAEHAFASKAERLGSRLNTSWLLYDHMVKERPSCGKSDRDSQYSVTEPICRAFLEDAPFEN